MTVSLSISCEIPETFSSGDVVTFIGMDGVTRKIKILGILHRSEFSQLVSYRTFDYSLGHEDTWAFEFYFRDHGRILTEYIPANRLTFNDPAYKEAFI